MADQIQELLSRGVEEVIDRRHLEEALRSKKKLRVKLGIDPTSPNIHIGRACPLWKLKAFQELGHKAVFIVGDFTGVIGDTSDKESERPMLSEKEVKANGATYFEQVFKILNKKQTEVHFNSKWLKKLGALELAKISNLFGLHEFTSREVIARRIKADKRVSYLELMYPMMQGYDSVAVKADVELGGTDQRFNLLVGRDIQRFYKQKPQDIMMLRLMEGTDGRKMSSSWGNTINITDDPNNMFGKIMSIPDSLIKKYFVLATRMPLNDVDEIMKLPNPRDQKEILASEIAKIYHGDKKAVFAKENFNQIFRSKGIPNDIKEKELKPGKYKLSEILLRAGFVSSKSEARRLFEQRGVKLNDQITQDCDIELNGKDIRLIQVGKRKFIQIK